MDIKIKKTEIYTDTFIYIYRYELFKIKKTEIYTHILHTYRSLDEKNIEIYKHVYIKTKCKYVNIKYKYTGRNEDGIDKINIYTSIHIYRHWQDSKINLYIHKHRYKQD